jgi:excisionase family DNA binding protein
MRGYPPLGFRWGKRFLEKDGPKMDKENLTLPKLLRPAELSDHLGVPKPTIYSWVRRGDIPFVKLGGLVRFDPGEIHDWLKERKHPARKKLLFLREASLQG